jgi:hypothetical protein
MIKKIIGILKNCEERITNHKDIGTDFYIMINKIISEFYRLHPQKVRYAIILMYCVLL